MQFGYEYGVPLLSVRTVFEGFELCCFIAKRYLMEGRFEVGKWDLNSGELFSKIGTEEVDKEFINVHYKSFEESLRFRKVLGLNWGVENGLIIFDFTNNLNLVKSLVLVKRNLLKINATFFNPLRLFSPTTLQENIF